MFNKFYLALLIFLAPLSISNAQQNVQELTLSIVDTTQSTYYQANQIYNWIITNIAFDVKSYKNLECLNYTVPEILKKRKGLCNEFALLFSTMCNSANIEAYCIAAYLKGPGYYSGKPFLRAEHAINVFMYDSVWHFVDPTLGSGYIFEDAKTYRKILHRAFKLPAAKQKLKFISEPDSAWFDIPVEMLLGKLYPLDPKWFVTDRPYSFESFEKDSLLERTEYPDYLNNILSIRGTSPENILKQEGVNGIRFNDHNYFDIANGYVTIASNYYLERNILRTNVDQFEKYNDEFQIAFDAIKKHMALNDSVYRARKTSLKALSQNHNKISKKIDSKAKSAQSSFRSGNRQTSGKSLSYRRKIESYLLKAEKTKIQIVPDSITRDSVKTDSKKVKDLYSEWLTFELSEPGLQHKTDSFFLLLDKQFIDDAKIDDSINFKNYLFADIILGLNSAIEINNEDSIRAYVDTLITIYYDIGDLLTRKKSTKKTIDQKSKGYYNYARLLQANLKSQGNLLKKLYRETNYSDSVRTGYNNALKQLVRSYEQSMKYTRKLDNHNMLQADSREVNLRALKMQRKELRHESRNFNAWYELRYNLDEKKYSHEKEVAKVIMSNAQSNKRLVGSKLKKYYQLNEKN